MTNVAHKTPIRTVLTYNNGVTSKLYLVARFAHRKITNAISTQASRTKKPSGMKKCARRHALIDGVEVGDVDQ